jgi:hypothetical protein
VLLGKYRHPSQTLLGNNPLTWDIRGLLFLHATKLLLKRKPECPNVMDVPISFTKLMLFNVLCQDLTPLFSLFRISYELSANPPCALRMPLTPYAVRLMPFSYALRHASCTSSISPFSPHLGKLSETLAWLV